MHLATNSPRPLTIGILVAEPFRSELPSVGYLADAIERAGHVVEWVDPQALSVLTMQGEAHALCGGEAINVDGMLRWLSASNTRLVQAALEVLEASGIPFLNSNEAVRRSSNKWSTALAMTKFKLPHPATALVRTEAEIMRMAEALGFPVIVKRLMGFGGSGVGMAADTDELYTVLRTLRPHGDSELLLMQRFLPEAAGRDLRVVVVGNQVVDALERVALVPGEFRANVMRGGRRVETDITREEATIAAAAVKAVGLDWGGVDLARSKRGAVVIEVNATPGFGDDPAPVPETIANAIIDLLLDRIRAAQSRSAPKAA